MKELLYGVAYYPEYEHEQRIEQDLNMIKEAGMNTIRIAESTWSTWEPEEGIYDFTILKAVLNECTKRDIKVIIGTPTYAVPSWLVKKDPAVMVTTKTGRALYGRRQTMDIMNTTYRNASEKIIIKIMEEVSGYDCVIGYQIDNETKHYGTASENVQKIFVNHLKKKFGTVDAMNQALGLAYWSNSIGKWEDFPDVRGTINGSLAAEFERFQRCLAADFLMWQRQIVDKYRRPEQFVVHNLDFDWKPAPVAPFGYSYGVQGEINHMEASKALTICGADIYHPNQDDLTGVEIAFCGDSIRSLKDAPYLVLEAQAQGFRYWTPYPGQIRQQAFSHLASGANGLEYWHWHSIHNSFETYWKGVLSHDMCKNAVYDECVTVGHDFKMLSPYLQKTIKKNKVAIVIDNLSLTALNYFPIGDYPGMPGSQCLSYNDVVRCYYDALYEQNIECDIIDVQKLKQCYKKYKMLITPAMYCASDETLDILREFVQEGGILISSFKSFFVDENVKVRAEKQPYKMTDVFGMYYQEFTRPGNTTIRGKAIDVFEELLIPTTAESENYEHHYWGRYAGITTNKFGKGYGVYIGCWCDKTIIKDILKKMAEKAGIVAAPYGFEFPIVLKTLVNGSGENIHFLFNYSNTIANVTCPYKSYDLLKNIEYRIGDTIKLDEWGCVILLEV